MGGKEEGFQEEMKELEGGFLCPLCFSTVTNNKNPSGKITCF